VSDDPGWASYLDRARQHPFFVAYKARLHALLQVSPGSLCLEVGSGTGDDALAVARSTGATVVATDAAAGMAAEARRRGQVLSLAADVSRLPFASGGFDACWADRVLQHVAEPERAVEELIRVTRPGGRVVVVDPDYTTQSACIDDGELAERVLGHRRDVLVRNGNLAARMGTIFAERGLGDVCVESRRLTLTTPAGADALLGLSGWARTAPHLGALLPGDGARWVQAVNGAAERGDFAYSIVYRLTLGTRQGWAVHGDGLS
jgi:SAM-dependent methyltransferase